MSSNPSDLPVGVVVHIKLKDASGFEALVEDFAPLHAHANTKEGQTILYDIHTRDDDPLGLVIYEKYINERALTETHNNSEPFKAFVAKMGTVNYIEKLEVITTKIIDHPKLAAATSQCPLRVGDGILVFCGARNGKNPANVVAGASMGAAIAKRGRTLVYGGGTVGIMGAVVTAALAGKGRIKSVIPRSMISREVSGEMQGDVTLTHTMSQRKSIMFSHSNTVIILPGGLGTFDELLETITLLQLNAYRPKIGFLNVGNFFEAFFVFLRHLISEGYVEDHIFDFFVVENSGDGEALLAKLDAFEVPVSPAQLQWTLAKPF